MGDDLFRLVLQQGALLEGVPVSRLLKMVNAIQAHENATAEEDEMKPQVPSAANIAALSKLLADPI